MELSTAFSLWELAWNDMAQHRTCLVNVLNSLFTFNLFSPLIQYSGFSLDILSQIKTFHLVCGPHVAVLRDYSGSIFRNYSKDSMLHHRWNESDCMQNKSFSAVSSLRLHRYYFLSSFQFLSFSKLDPLLITFRVLCSRQNFALFCRPTCHFLLPGLLNSGPTCALNPIQGVNLFYLWRINE